MAANYVLLEKITVGAAGASSVTFSGIPQTGYTDLVVYASPRSARGAVEDELWIRLNGDTGNNYSYRSMNGDGTTASSQSGSSIPAVYRGWMPGNTTTANTFGNHCIYIPNYASANYKSLSGDDVSENNATSARATLRAGLWSNTAAITSVTLLPEVSTFMQYSTFYLYGVAALGTTPVIVPYATGGDTIMTDGTYWYHTFVSSGTFTPAKALTADYLVVAGGGGGGDPYGGGGGAGGYRTSIGGSPLSLGTSAVTVTVGAGGAVDTNGSNSVFSSITSSGGGRGGRSLTTGAAGGSGGGGSGDAGSTAGTGNSGSFSPSEGNNGGAGTTSGSLYGCGGGGGAGAVGSVGTTIAGGNGGSGSTSSISGTSVTRAGGGGGGIEQLPGTVGAGGSGGGGSGAVGSTPNTASTAGTVNTGGGGGGGSYSGGVGAAGGSGTIIVRYAV